MAPNTAPTVLQAIPPALAFLVPLVAIVLLVSALAHQPVQARIGVRGRKSRIEGISAYIAISILGVLSTLYGVLGLRTTLGDNDGVGLGRRGKGELVTEALIFMEVGVAVIYLGNEYASVDFQAYWTIVLVIELVCATIVYLVCVAVSQSVPANVPPALCLIFIASGLSFLLLALRVHTTKHTSGRRHVTPTEGTRTPSFSGTRLSTIRSSEPASPASSLHSTPSSESSHESHQKFPSLSVSSTSDLTVVNHLQPPFAIRSNALGEVDVEVGTGQSAANLSPLGLKTTHTRSKTLLVILSTSQFAFLVAFVLEIVAVNVSHSVTSNSGPSPATKTSSAYAILQILQTALMVLCIIGVMAAFLLHAYNAYLRAASTTHQATVADTTLPATVNMSRLNAITVSLSTTTTTSPPLAANKRRTSTQPCAPSAFDKTAKKLCIGGHFTDIALNTVHSQVVFTNTNLGHCNHGSQEGRCLGKAESKFPSRRNPSTSSSSSFESPMTRDTPSNSVLMAPEARQPIALHKPIRDSKFDDDDDSEPGYAYIYTEKSICGDTDPLDVGLAVPFKAQTPHKAEFASSVSSPPSKLQLSLNHSHNGSAYTDEAVENSFSSQTLTLPRTPSTPVDIPLSKSLSNPYPTPRSTPTSTSFADSPVIPTFLSSPARSSMEFGPRPTTSKSNKFRLKISKQSVERPQISEMPGAENQHCDSRCSTPTLSRQTTPTPTPTRAPTPGLSLTPFIGAHVSKRDSTGSRSRPHSPSSPTSFMANLKGKAKNLSSKHDSIVQGLEGIRNGLGSSGKTKYPLRSSNSHSSLGLGISSSFRFPQLTRRASEIDKGRRNRSSSTLACSAEGTAVDGVGEGDFMDLRDPFAPPTIAEGCALRIVSPEELNLRSGRESRIGHREEDLFDTEKDGSPWTASVGRAKGQRMSAWGNLPLCHSNPSSPVRPSSSAPKLLSFRSKHKGEKKTKAKSKGSSKSEGNSPDRPQPPLHLAFHHDDFAFEEALLAQQLLKRLDESL